MDFCLKRWRSRWRVTWSPRWFNFWVHVQSRGRVLTIQTSRLKTEKENSALLRKEEHKGSDLQKLVPSKSSSNSSKQETLRRDAPQHLHVLWKWSTTRFTAREPADDGGRTTAGVHKHQKMILFIDSIDQLKIWRPEHAGWSRAALFDLSSHLRKLLHEQPS